MNLTGQSIYEKGQKPAKSKPLRDASRGAVCQLAIPGVCRSDPEYVVGCHVSIPGMAAGMGQKNDDLFLIDGCDRCHAIFDNRDAFASAPIDWLDVLRALMKSQQQRRASGLILIAGE
mgnify:CR=1 FL=1